MMRRPSPARFALVAAAALALGVGACGASASGPAAAGPIVGEGRRVLFVGNSLTYVNDLPAIVAALADSAGVTLNVRAVAFPDHSLEDHWARGNAAREIARGGWEVVVLQQGPSSVEANRENLRDFTRRFGAEIAKVGATPALYSVWPQASRRADFDRAIESYAIAARDVGGVYLPVAAAWLAAWRRDASLPLYDADGLHPSGLGSYLAGLVIAGRLTGTPVADLPARIRLSGGALLDAGSAAPVLRAAAAEALGASGASALVNSPSNVQGAR